MAKATDTLMKERESGAAETIMGGLGGTLSTAELMKARRAYNDYAVEADTGGGDRLTFDEFVRQKWAK